MEFLDIGSPVIVRSYTSGVFVGRLQSANNGDVVVTHSRHLRSWKGVGGSGSVYDLVSSGIKPTDRGSTIEGKHLLARADVFEITEEQYNTLAN